MNDQPKRVYAVTMRATAEMVVWVEARSNAGARLLAEAGEYDVMTEWTPRDYSKVKAAKAKLSAWPPDAGKESASESHAPDGWKSNEGQA